MWTPRRSLPRLSRGGGEELVLACGDQRKNGRAGADGRFVASAIWTLFRQGSVLFPGSVQFYRPTEVSRQPTQAPSGNRRPQQPGGLRQPTQKAKRTRPASRGRARSAKPASSRAWGQGKTFTARKKNRSERKGRRSLDTSTEYKGKSRGTSRRHNRGVCAICIRKILGYKELWMLQAKLNDRVTGDGRSKLAQLMTRTAIAGFN
jgi:hypothetical protein